MHGMPTTQAPRAGTRRAPAAAACEGRLESVTVAVPLAGARPWPRKRGVYEAATTCHSVHGRQPPAPASDRRPVRAQPEVTTIIRRLAADDAPALLALRRRALESDPLVFGSSVDDDSGLSLEFLRIVLADAHEHAVFGHFEGAELAGMVGLVRDTKTKRRHLATIWGMFVAPRARSHGAGRALLEAAVTQPRQWPGLAQVQLSVSDIALHARRLYESVGFRPWGREPRALHWSGRFVDEYHLALDLEHEGGRPGSRETPRAGRGEH